MEVPEGRDPETRETYQYMLEVLGDYERYVKDLGHLELAAPNLLYYRDEVQEVLDLLQSDGLELKEVWRKVVELDNVLRSRASELVAEIGHANFKQYQIMVDPPQKNWWWFLNRVVPPAASPPRSWEFWKRPQA